MLENIPDPLGDIKRVTINKSMLGKGKWELFPSERHAAKLNYGDGRLLTFLTWSSTAHAGNHFYIDINNKCLNVK